MKLTEELIFPPFRLDLVNEQLWCEHQLVPLRPKTFAVLRFLVEHAGRLLTKEELLKGVWPDTRVSEGILKGYIRDLRDILGDDARQPRFIETVPRRGHRFIGQVISSQHSVVSREQASGVRSPASTVQSSQSLTPNTQHLTPVLVGRKVELAKLHSLFGKALAGERQIVFVTGEPGIGKTTLVEEFLFGVRSREKFGVQNSEPRTLNTELPSTPDLWIGRGQCVEQHGAGEAYLPVLEALGRIGRAPGGEQFIAILHQHAPTWLAQMPALLAAEELETVQRRVVGATRERMLREMVEAIEALTAHRPLVLWFEDLHWADASTVDWLAAVAHRGATAPLLVIGTYRPSDLSLSGHPLRAVKQELIAKGQCEELWLPFLSAEDVAHYLTRRYPQHQFPSGLGTAIHRRTDGNPLFVVNMMEYLAAQGEIAEVDGRWRLQTTVDEVGRGVPESLRQLIEKHIERLGEEPQRLLEVASVVGVTFSATAVAAELQIEVETVDQQCEILARTGHFLRAQGIDEWPDGTMGGRYSFLHALYQQGLYERVTEARRVRLHRRIGEQKETAYGERAGEIAAELAVHFEKGHEIIRAVRYLGKAGETAVHRSAHQEAIIYLRKGLDLLATLSETPERTQQELALQIALGSSLIITKGYAAPEVEQVYAHAQELCRRVGGTPQLVPSLLGLCGFYFTRADLKTGHAHAQQLLALAQQSGDPELLLIAHTVMAMPLHWQGEAPQALRHLEQALSFYKPRQNRVLLNIQDPGVTCLCFQTEVLWILGYPEQARACSLKAVALAQSLSHFFSETWALHCAMLNSQRLQDSEAALAYAESLVALSAEHGFPYFLAHGTIVKGWGLVMQGQIDAGLTQIHHGLTALQAIGAAVARPYFLALWAEAWEKAGEEERGRQALTEALNTAHSTGERFYEAELYRLQGELTLARASRKAKVKSQKSKIPSLQPLAPSTRVEVEQEAEECFLKALDIARRQQAKSLELRAVMSLVRLRQQQATHASRNTQHVSRNRLAEAHKLLSEIYHWFTEGFDTPDLQDAKALLDARA